MAQFCSFSFSSKQITKKLHPNWVTGFTDAEGGFHISITKDKRNNCWSIIPVFSLEMHTRDPGIPGLIQEYFGNIEQIPTIKTRNIYKL